MRSDNTRNVRLEISSTNPFAHLIAATGRSATISGFGPGYSAGSAIYCTDCRNNDE